MPARPPASRRASRRWRGCSMMSRRTSSSRASARREAGDSAISTVLPRQPSASLPELERDGQLTLASRRAHSSSSRRVARAFGQRASAEIVCRTRELAAWQQSRVMCSCAYTELCHVSGQMGVVAGSSCRFPGCADRSEERPLLTDYHSINDPTIRVRVPSAYSQLAAMSCQRRDADGQRRRRRPSRSSPRSGSRTSARTSRISRWACSSRPSRRASSMAPRTTPRGGLRWPTPSCE